MTHDSLGNAAKERSRQPASTMRAEDDEIGVFVLGHLDEGAAGRGVLNDAELYLGDPFEKLGGLPSEGLANGILDLDPNASFEQVGP